MRKRPSHLQRARRCHQSVRSDLIKIAEPEPVMTSWFGRHTSGHEFVGEIVALGLNFLSANGEQATPNGRPALYSTLRVGDKVVSPFTVSCGECQYVLTFAL